jgi:regulator of sigma E protease
MGILITLLGLSVVVFLHELGHMLAAKRVGVGVSEFSVGMGPKLIKYQWGETLYVLRLFPLGGFVRLAGLDDQENKDAPNAYPNKTIMQRFWTIFWGPLMNFILGFVIFFSIFAYQGVPNMDTLIVSSVTPSFPTAMAGLQANDILLEMDTIKLESVTQLIAYINQKKESPIQLKFSRNDKEKIVSVTPKQHQGNYVIGVVFESQFQKGSLIQVTSHAMIMTKGYVVSVFKGIGMLITGKASVKDMTGPIGIIQFASFNLDKGLVYFFNVMAMISISLGVINLFPFPVLDGGHIMMLIIEAIRGGKKVSHKWFVAINNVGAAILITLMVFIIINDIRFWQDRVTLFKSLFGP